MPDNQKPEEQQPNTTEIEDITQELSEEEMEDVQGGLTVKKVSDYSKSRAGRGRGA
ncbi:hypothetical protein ACFFSY_14160 [Paenibacillus aurantiacus]|uniref:Bacteriocin n=1 Tax=Paenibacillus aurantiacus TaxID=1936118 RepID=A0ABV5KPB9_9BACL